MEKKKRFMGSSYGNGFRERFEKQTTEDLLYIIKVQREGYQENAVKIIESILTERGVELVIEEEKLEKNKVIVKDEKRRVKSTKTNYSILSFVIGIALILLAFYRPQNVNIDADTVMIINITVNICMRLFVVMWNLHLVKLYKLNKTIWVVLGLLFGGWSLLAISLFTGVRVDQEKNNEPIKETVE